MLSSLNRYKIKQNLSNDTFDLVIIGGGVTGAGIALDAVTRGMKVALVEMQDFAAGTSSRSTKLVHGGLRYLKQFDIAVVAETGKERAIVYENGPHVTTPEWMMLPFYKGGTFGPFTTNIGLRVYDLLAGVKKTERRKMFSVEEAIQREPLLNAKELKGAGYYVEYKTDDARLTLEVMKKAVEEGALALNYMKASNLIYEDRKVIGIEVEDQIDGSNQKVFAKKIVNATGPWVDTLRELDQSKKGKFLHLTKGIHLVFDGEIFPLQQAIYFDSVDGRMLFAIPRDGKTYVGTTDTVYTGDIANPKVTIEDRDYVLGAIEYMFPDVKIQAEDIESSWAGLRPLIYKEGKSPSEISRKDEVFVSDSGFISIAGGKLTGYRKMAESVVDIVAKQFEQENYKVFSSIATKELSMSGGDVGGSKGFTDFIVVKKKAGVSLGLEEEIAEALVKRYGSNVDIIFDLLKECKSDENPPSLEPVLEAVLNYSMKYELAYKPIDFFIRRTGDLFFQIDRVEKEKEQVISYMAKTLQWTDEQTQLYTEELNKHLESAKYPVENDLV